MRPVGLLCLIIWAIVCPTGCGSSRAQKHLSPSWTTGFWFWHGSEADLQTSVELLDLLYVQVGNIDDRDARFRQRTVESFLPERPLPKAKHYWLVYRYQHQGVPDLSTTAELADQIAQLYGRARQRNLPVAGIQFDIDSPTRALPEYAVFLRELRRELKRAAASEVQISITALLDWFRDGTAIADVIQQADEFVPQFYDVAKLEDGGTVIAAKVDAQKWAPRFNRFGKRYYIGISTFGRARLTHSSEPRVYFGDLSPADIAGNSAFHLDTSTNEVGEMVLHYQATRSTQAGYSTMQPGDMIQFVLPTPQAVRTAVTSAKQMGGDCAGILFFRWPSSNEALAMPPDEVLAAAGVSSIEPQRVAVKAIDGHCDAVNCTDLYFMETDRLAPAEQRYRIRSSAPLDYFLPAERAPVRLAGPSELEVKLSAYGGRPRVRLGRAVSSARVTFTVEKLQ